MNNQTTYPTGAPIITLTPCKSANRLAIAAFVCGIIGVVSVVFGFVPGFLGYAFYIDARRKGSDHGLMTPAKVLCIISMVLPAALFCLPIGCTGLMAATFSAL